MPIKPGGMGSKLAGEPPDKFADSMAQAIEGQLNALLIADGLDPLPLENTPEVRDRRRLFVAISRGIVQHLSENLDAIRVRRLDNSQVSPTMNVNWTLPLP
jgi:hypothetical protein